jgi:hypothetical protein
MAIREGKKAKRREKEFEKNDAELTTEEGKLLMILR